MVVVFVPLHDGGLHKLVTSFVVNGELNSVSCTNWLPEVALKIVAQYLSANVLDKICRLMIFMSAGG